MLIPDSEIQSMITDDPSVRRLLILPDGALVHFPFEALVAKRNGGESVFLLDCPPAVLYSPSASVYHNLSMRETERKPSRTALTVGNAIYRSNRTGLGGGDDIPRGILDRLQELPHTRKEIENVEKSCKECGKYGHGNDDVKKLERHEATKARVVEKMPGRDVIHLACHCIVIDDHDKLFTFLVFTAEESKPSNDNECLMIAEILRLDLTSCGLAILSACDTNTGTFQHGEGAWSIARSFLASGSNRVVVSDWKVEDESTAELITAFVEEINGNDDSDFAIALQEAKRTLRKNYPHPYFWSPFVLIGTH